ncbi:MAG: TRAP transporter small permease [Verrucomicrobia bacterium]|nr:TRAP transporter small permease [Verrucomicrobiota bacterium]
MTSGEDKVRTDHLLCAGILGTMAVVAFINVLGRYLFHYSLAFTEEITINLFVWLVVIGSGLAFERGSQLGMVSLYRKFPRRWQRAASFISAALSSILVLAVVILLIRSIHQEMALFHARSPALGVPVWIYYAGVPVFSFYLLRGIWRSARSVPRTSNTEHRTPNIEAGGG